MTIPVNVRRKVISLRGELPAQEIADQCGISLRSVTRIWQEDAAQQRTDSMTDTFSRIRDCMAEGQHYHPITPEAVQAMTIDHLDELMLQRDHYKAMQEAQPTNCAWGNLVSKTNQQIFDVLRTMGRWYGLENQKEPLTWIGLKNRDLEEIDMGQILQRLHADPDYKAAHDKDGRLRLDDGMKMILKLRFLPVG